MLIGSDYQVSTRNYQLYSGLFDQSVLKNSSLAFFKGTFTVEATQQHTTRSCCIKSRHTMCLVILSYAVHEIHLQRKGVQELRLFLWAWRFAGNEQLRLEASNHKYEPVNEKTYHP